MSALSLIPVAGTAVVVAKHGDDIAAGLKFLNKAENIDDMLEVKNDIEKIYKEYKMLDFGIDLGINGPLSIGVHGMQGNEQAAITDGTHSVVDIWSTSIEEYLGDSKASAGLIEDLIKYVV